MAWAGKHEGPWREGTSNCGGGRVANVRLATTEAVLFLLAFFPPLPQRGKIVRSAQPGKPRLHSQITTTIRCMMRTVSYPIFPKTQRWHILHMLASTCLQTPNMTLPSVLRPKVSDLMQPPASPGGTKLICSGIWNAIALLVLWS